MSEGSSKATRCCARYARALTCSSTSLSQIEPVSATPKAAPTIPTSTSAKWWDGAAGQAGVPSTSGVAEQITRACGKSERTNPSRVLPLRSSTNFPPIRASASWNSSNSDPAVLSNSGSPEVRAPGTGGSRAPLREWCRGSSRSVSCARCTSCGTIAAARRELRAGGPMD